MKNILYIFPGAYNSGLRAGLPGTQYYGYEYMNSFGMSAEAIGRDDALPKWLVRSIFGKLFSYRVRHLLLFFKARSYRIVFGAALVYLMPLKKIFGGRAKYVALNIELVRMIRANAKRPFRLGLIKAFIAEFSAVVCLAHVQKEWLLAQCPFLEGKIHVVLLGADVQSQTPVYEGRNTTVLSVGADGGRDYETLFEAARLLPDTSFEIVCSPHNITHIKNQPSNVEVFFDLPFAEVKKKYHTAQLLVLSTHDDTYADGADCSGQTVLLDAMTNGIPVLATRKAYLSDYIRERTDALVVNCYDPKAMVQEISRLQSDETLRAKLAYSARAHAEQYFSTKSMAEGLGKVFNTLG